ncbi:hypothetical protein ACHAXT_010918 [Thalassiosira profunda]
MWSFHALGWIIASLALLDMARKAALIRSMHTNIDGGDKDGMWRPPQNNASRIELRETVHEEDAIQRSEDRIPPPPTDNTDSSNENKERCLLSLPDCDLSCLEWTIVLATGRSGSTAVLQMMAELPGMHFYGEEGGLLDHMHKFQERVDKSGKKGSLLSWMGAGDSDVHTLACMTQKFYAERHRDTCLHRGCRHGWKEIRYSSPESVEWIRTIFPSAKLILNYRGSCAEGYQDIFGRGCESINGESAKLLEATQNMTGVFHMQTEQLSNLTRWRELSEFLGYEGCEAKKMAGANKNGGYTPVKKRAKNLWDCR